MGVLAVEPSPTKTRFIEEVAKANGLDAHVTVVPCALGSEPGRGAMSKVEGDVVFMPGGFFVDPKGGDEFDVRTLDDVYEAHVGGHLSSTGMEKSAGTPPVYLI